MAMVVRRASPKTPGRAWASLAVGVEELTVPGAWFPPTLPSVISRMAIPANGRSRCPPASVALRPCVRVWRPVGPGHAWTRATTARDCVGGQIGGTFGTALLDGARRVGTGNRRALLDSPNELVDLLAVVSGLGPDAGYTRVGVCILFTCARVWLVPNAGGCCGRDFFAVWPVVGDESAEQVAGGSGRLGA